MAMPVGFAVLIEPGMIAADCGQEMPAAFSAAVATQVKASIVVSIRRVIWGVIAAVGEVGSALQLRDSGELPAVDGSVDQVIGVDQRSQINRVSGVEQVSAIRGQGAVVRMRG